MPKPAVNSLPAPDVQSFRLRLDEVLDFEDDQGNVWANAKWGVYAFYDYDGEPIYVGQTNEQLRVRVRRHLTNQRTDAVAMRILDPFEVAEIELWPLWEYESIGTKGPLGAAAKAQLNALEHSVYHWAIDESKFGAILNEKIPPVSPLIELPASMRASLLTDAVRAEREHPDIRIARRADTLARLSAVARERGIVTPGLRRVIVVQAMRLAYLAGARLAFAEGRPAPDPRVIQSGPLFGDVTEETENGSEDALAPNNRRTIRRWLRPQSCGNRFFGISIISEGSVSTELTRRL
ncbi:GIY-YIG nuclease family protein [Glycomyces sp. NPDC048151]|uniref:GIY-YIG nuclease family protein n=1 Tax=Glycomyces sp. NPDC048151 TaxID=3364002 RepID=UPI00370FA48E